MQLLLYENHWRLIRLLWCTKRWLGNGYTESPCYIYQHMRQTFIYVKMLVNCLSHSVRTDTWMLQQIEGFLVVNQWWSMGRNYKDGKLLLLTCPTCYEEHVASSVITWGTLLFHSNLCVLFFQGPLRLKRTDAALPFCSGLSTWLSVQRSRKRRPVHVPSDWHVAHFVCMEGQEGSYACKNQAKIHVEHKELFQKAELPAAATISRSRT